jgi:fructosamine-3-kinase
MTDDAFWKAVAARIKETTGETVDPKPKDTHLGGCINRAARMEGKKLSFFVKYNSVALDDMIASEAYGLAYMFVPFKIRVPMPVVNDKTEDRSYLILEWLDLGGSGNWSAMGENLARLHQLEFGDKFGFDRDNYIGSTPQINTYETDWITFFTMHRLDYQIKLARGKGAAFPRYEELRQAIPKILEGRENIKPALVHGDLWSGNASFTKEGTPVIFDPATYKADPEVDLAMTELFGGFPREFYEGYAKISPISKTYERRKDLYNLYHVLNHYNLFGGHYENQANRMIAVLTTLHN